MTRHDELAVKLYIRRLNLSFGSLTPRTHTRRRIWHHTAGTMSTTAIHNYHRNVRGWAGIGYHFHILLDGTIDRGRPIGIIGAHAGGHNSDSIGIAIQGNLMNRQMTAAQKESAENLRAYLDRIYGTLIDQEHRQVGATLCPGTNFVMPTGLPGELYISGDGVAQGYLNNDKLTQESFVDNPFILGQKMYKTGDMGRYLKTGLIEYIGRVDTQVKIRGHRTELGEIERCLIGISGVKNAAVILKESLTAYIVGTELSEQGLKHQLSESLPRYMIPTHFVFLDQLPLTINGKVDTASLPEPKSKEFEFKAAITEIEKELISAIEEILAIDHVGMNDNFYQLGGDSIKAIQISSRLFDIGYVLKTKDILSYQTVGEIATTVEVVGHVVIDQGMVSGNFGLTPIMKWFFSQNFANAHHYHQSISLKIDDFDQGRIEKVLERLVWHHDALRLNYDRSNGRLFYNNEVSEMVVDYFDLSICSSDEQDRLVEDFGFRLKSGINIEKGLLFKVGAFNLGAKGHLLLLTAHHLVVDGVSWQIILEDLDFLLSMGDNQKVKLPLKTHSFMEWSHWLSQYSGKIFDFEKEYWQDVLAHPFHYPVDFDSGFDTVGMSSTLNTELDVCKTKELLTVVGDVYGTGVHETLTIALAILIKALTGENDIVIELESHGREEMDSGLNVSRTIGWFTSLYPISLKMADESLDFNIKYLKEQLRKIPNKGFDYGILKYLKNELAEQSRNHIRFNYLGNYENSMKRNAFQLAQAGYVFDTDQGNRLTAILDINAIIVDSKLIIAVQFSRKKFLEENIQNFLNQYIEMMTEMIELSRLEPNKKFTPSDFSASDISQEDLDSLFG